MPNATHPISHENEQQQKRERDSQHRKTSNRHVIYCLRNEALFIKLAN